MEELTKIEESLDDVISVIKDSREYKMCIQLRKQMKDNKEIQTRIEEIKNLQKEYIKSGYQDEKKNKLREKEEALNNIPVCAMYNENLEIVNQMIIEINDSLNAYFYSKLNSEIEF